MSCEHNETFADETTGDYICISCGLVLDRFYFGAPEHSVFGSNNIDAEIGEIYLFIADIYSRGNIASGTFQQVLNKYYNMYNKSYRGEKKKQLACFAIYSILSEADIPRTLEEIACLSGVPIEKIWSIEKKENGGCVADCSENFVERICRRIDLPYKDLCAIKTLVTKLSGISGCRANTLIAAVLWLYVNEVICSCATLKEICIASNVTPSSVRKLINKINPRYRENICLLLSSLSFFFDGGKIGLILCGGKNTLDLVSFWRLFIPFSRAKNLENLESAQCCEKWNISTILKMGIKKIIYFIHRFV